MTIYEGKLSVPFHRPSCAAFLLRKPLETHWFPIGHFQGEYDCFINGLPATELAEELVERRPAVILVERRFRALARSDGAQHGQKLFQVCVDSMVTRFAVADTPSERFDYLDRGLGLRLCNLHSDRFGKFRAGPHGEEKHISRDMRPSIGEHIQ